MYWTGIDCGDPGELANGNVTFRDSFVESITTYKCDFGFRLEGNAQRTCQENGTWNGTVPMCQRKYTNTFHDTL